MRRTQEMDGPAKEAEKVRDLALRLVTKGRPPTIPSEELRHVRERLKNEQESGNSDPKIMCSQTTISKILEGRSPRTGHLRTLAAQMGRFIHA